MAAKAAAFYAAVPSVDRSGGLSNSTYSRWKGGPIRKMDISEPTLIASTCHIDMVPLPAGASLKNGLYCDYDKVLFNGDARRVSTHVSTTLEVDPQKKRFLKNFGRSRSGEKKVEV